MARILLVFLASIACLGQAPQEAPAATAPKGVRLLRSQSGPSGKLVGSEFVLDETRSRFVAPQDRGLVVYFQWDAPPGDHALTGIWKDPSGKVNYISPDIRVQTTSSDLKAYWSYEIYPTLPSGVWTLEVRVDGQPAGEHPFELVVPAQQTALTVNDIYRASVGSMVWVHKLNTEGRRVDTSSGFVYGQDRVLTAFQAIDASDGVEVEFADGRSEKTDQVWSANRMQDWALVKVPTREIQTLPIDAQGRVEIGGRGLIFNVESGMLRTVGGVDVTGMNRIEGFGDRLQIAPVLAAETAGGPFIGAHGKVLGVLGGAVVPGGRSVYRVSSQNSPYWASTSSPGGAIPINLVRDSENPTTLAALLSAGTLTPPLHPSDNFIAVITGTVAAKERDGMVSISEQFTRDQSIAVHSQWIGAEEERKGTISATVYDASGRKMVTVDPRKMNLDKQRRTDFRFSFTLPNAPRGSYRIDLIWNESVVARTFVSIKD